MFPSNLLGGDFQFPCWDWRAYCCCKNTLYRMEWWLLGFSYNILWASRGHKRRLSTFSINTGLFCVLVWWIRWWCPLIWITGNSQISLIELNLPSLSPIHQWAQCHIDGYIDGLWVRHSHFTSFTMVSICSLKPLIYQSVAKLVLAFEFKCSVRRKGECVTENAMVAKM